MEATEATEVLTATRVSRLEVDISKLGSGAKLVVIPKAPIEMTVIDGKTGWVRIERVCTSGGTIVEDFRLDSPIIRTGQSIEVTSNPGDRQWSGSLVRPAEIHLVIDETL
jgi:hypothetical protein